MVTLNELEVLAIRFIMCQMWGDYEQAHEIMVSNHGLEAYLADENNIVTLCDKLGIKH